MNFLYYKKMRPRMRAYTTLVLLIVNTFVSVQLTELVSKYFLITFFGGVFVFGAYLISIKCPKCDEPIIKNEIIIFGLNTHMWLPLPGKRCRNCGGELD